MSRPTNVGGIAIALRLNAAGRLAAEVWRRCIYRQRSVLNLSPVQACEVSRLQQGPVAKRSVHWPDAASFAAIVRDLRSTDPTSALNSGSWCRQSAYRRGKRARLRALPLSQWRRGVPRLPVARLANGSISAALGQVAERKHHQASVPGRFSPAANSRHPPELGPLLGQPG
jgi:hypothetical protein